MARHDQRAIPKNTVCMSCQRGECNHCVDVIRAIAGFSEELCHCKRKNHSIEPNTQQILDPETGTVYAPGLHVTKEGKVIRE